MDAPLPPVDRTWLLTWTTYGSWLPGDARGSKLRVPDGSGRRVPAFLSGDAPAAAWLRITASGLLKRDPIRLTALQAEVAADAIDAQARYRGWTCFATAVMSNHVHVVIGVPADPPASTLLKTLKAYASRALNERWRRPESGTWWTQSGSTRLLRSEPAVIAAVRYVRDQEYPLVVRLDTRTWDGEV